MAFSQQGPYSTRSKKAIKFFEQSTEFLKFRQYPEAIVVLTQALEKDPLFMEAHARISYCYRVLGNMSKERYHLEQVLKLVPDIGKYKNTFYSLADVCYRMGDYAASQKYLQDLFKFQDLNANVYSEAKKLEKNVLFAVEAIKNPVDFNPVRLPEVINSGPLQYFPVLTVDEQQLFFTKRTGQSISYDEDIYRSVKNEEGLWSIPESISPNINTPHNEGTCSISADGRVLIFTSCDNRRGYGSCDLFISEKTGNEWSIPRNLGPVINSPNWDSQPALSADGNTLYFISDRPGGIGNRDIWMSYKSPDGEWGKPVNLGNKINTGADEVSPFIHSNGQTLYFSSVGYPGFGGYDLFKSEKLHGEWTTPENLGYPVNTNEDQVSLFVTASGKKAYYSLDQYTEDGYPISRIYTFDIPVEISVTNKSYYVKGRVTDKQSGDPLRSRLELWDIARDEWISYTFSDSITGEYYMVLTEGSEYAFYINKKGYMLETRNFTVEKGLEIESLVIDFELARIIEGEHSVLNNIFFDLDSYALKEKSYTELNRVSDFLESNPGIRVEISGHTDDTGSQDYNLNLSNKRAETVYNYLIEKGLSTEKLTYKGYGQTQPAYPNDSEENRSKNRRIEFSIIE